MALEDLLQFENPEVVAIALGVLLFVLSFSVIKRRINKGPAMIISFVLGLSVTWYLYKNPLELEQGVLAFLLIAVVIVIIFFFIIRPFFRNTRRHFG